MKLPLSVIIITKNEEANIADCLKSISQIASEIIIVDSKSMDKTIAIAKKFTNKIITGKFQNFKEKRELGLKNATCDWILFLDADERISSELAQEINEKITAKDGADGYYIPFRNFFLGKWLRYGGWYPEYHLRLARRKKASIENPIHETLYVDGKVEYLQNHIIHIGDKSLSHRVQKTNRYTTMQAEQRSQEKKPFMLLILMLCLMPILRFIKIFFFKKGFLDGMHGFIRAYLYMYTWFFVYMKEIEIKENEKNGRKVMEKIEV